MKKLVTILGLFILVVTSIFSFEINSTIFDQRIDTEDGYKEIVFKNRYSENMRYKVKILKSDKKETDMSSWVQISPAVLNIQPFSEKVLKIFAKAPKGTKNGEYAFKLKMEPIVIPTIRKSETKGVKGNSSIGFVPIIEMKGYVGNPDFEKNIDLENIKLKKVDKEYVLTGTLVNKSYAGKNIGFNFIGTNDFIVHGKWIGRIKAKTQEAISIEIPNKFKEISVYDAETNKEIKRIPMPKSL